MSLRKDYDRSLMIVNQNGALQLLLVPFQVRSLHSIDRIKEGMLVSVEAVADHPKDKIVYRILNKWHPYHKFLLIVRY